MKRFPTIDLQSADPATASLFDFVQSERGFLPKVYTAVGHSPNVAQALLDGAKAIAWPTSTLSIPSDLREILVLRLAVLYETDYEWGRHVRNADKFGVTPNQVATLDNWQASDAFSPRQRVALQMVDEVTLSARLSDETFNLALDTFTQREAVEIVGLATYYSMVNRIVNCLRVEMEDGDETIPFRPRRMAT